MHELADIKNFAAYWLPFVTEQGEQGQLGFAYIGKASSLPVTIHWTDKMGYHKKRITIIPSMRVR